MSYQDGPDSHLHAEVAAIAVEAAEAYCARMPAELAWR